MAVILTVCLLSVHDSYIGVSPPNSRSRWLFHRLTSSGSKVCCGSVHWQGSKWRTDLVPHAAAEEAPGGWRLKKETLGLGLADNAT